LLGAELQSVTLIRHGEIFAVSAHFYQKRILQVSSSFAAGVDYSECVWGEMVCEKANYEGKVPYVTKSMFSMQRFMMRK